MPTHGVGAHHNEKVRETRQKCTVIGGGRATAYPVPLLLLVKEVSCWNNTHMFSQADSPFSSNVHGKQRFLRLETGCKNNSVCGYESTEFGFDAIIHNPHDWVIVYKFHVVTM